MSTLTPILKLIKHEDNDNVRQGETIDASANMDIIDALFDPATGHDHDGTNSRLIDAMSNPMTAAGDIIVGGTDGEPERLAMGTALQLLRVKSDESGLEWVEPTHDTPTVPVCILTHSVNQSIADSTNTVLTWDTETKDTDTMHDPSTNPDRITIKTAGVYAISAALTWDAGVSTGDYTSAKIMLNGNEIIVDRRVDYPGSSYDSHHLSGIRSLSVNDYLQVQVYQKTGAALNVLADPALSFSVVRVA